MFEAKTYESIMSDMLARVPSDFDKREGSVIYDALAPAAVELANIYIELDAVLDETFADTASINYLARRVAERGLSQILATKAILQAEFTPSALEISIGARFSCDELNYQVTDKISAGVYKVECETAGTEGNEHFGQMIPIDYINGLESATITSLLIPARDDETASELRERYFNSMRSQAFGGNIADYKEKTKAINGVGGVKVTPVWNGGGTVKLTIQNTLFDVPSSALISEVQNAIDPVGHSGEGYGIAPIGHVVTVDGITALTVNIVTTITYEEGWDWASAGQYIKNAIDEYFDELAEGWEDESNIIVRISLLESRILNAQGVLDITGTTLNGSAANLSLTASQIPKRGTVNGNN